MEMGAEREAEKNKWENKEVDMMMEIKKLTRKVEKQEATFKEEVFLAQSEVRDLPYVMACASQHYWNSTGATTITYHHLLSDYNNADKPNGGDGELDITTGQFTCLTAGHYTVTFSGYVGLHPGEDVYTFIYHNGEQVKESVWHSPVGSTGGYMYDQGARTVIMHLSVGDTLD